MDCLSLRLQINRNNNSQIMKRVDKYGDKTRGNNVNVQLNRARTRHRKVFPEERTHT